MAILGAFRRRCRVSASPSIEQLASLYLGGKAYYLKKFAAALGRAIASGHLLREDRQEFLDIAAINFDAGDKIGR